MPFARVGAMPQPTSNSKQSKGQRFGKDTSSLRPKGITMEDLKKQTALRLALEQSQKHQDPSKQKFLPETGRDRPFRPLAEQQVGGYAHPGYASPANTYTDPQHGNGTPVAPKSSHPRYHPNQLQQSSPQTHQMTGYDQSYDQYNAAPARATPVLRYDHRQNSPRSSPHVPIQRMETKQEHQPQYLAADSASAPSIQTQSSFDRDPSSASKGSNKLPHGLTVHELKEMTKARLQAKNSDNSEISNEAVVECRRMSPLDFESLSEVRERAPSRDSVRNTTSCVYLHHGIDSTNSIPSMVQVNQPPREMHAGRQPQGSPLPPGFQNSGQYVALNSFSQAKSETWESASVASGSGSAYSGGVGSGMMALADSDPYFSGGRSFSAVQVVLSTEDGLPLSAHASPNRRGPSPFEQVIGGGNRRRAATLSPRADSIHEDRPSLHNDELGMPSFTSSNRGTLHSRPSRNHYSPGLDLGLDASLMAPPAGLVLFRGTDLNRPRTSSAASLPPVSQGFDDFNRNRANTFHGFSSGRPACDREAVSIPSALTDSFLNPPQRHGAESFNALAPPGFGNNNQTGSSSSRGGANGFHAFSSTGNNFGSAGSSFFASGGMDDLAESMGSILKLSGVGSDRPDRERSNTYPYSGFRS